eukprot:COSAG06_NODE_1036_length_10998_cov_27.475181_9_plen_115_part_00
MADGGKEGSREGSRKTETLYLRTLYLTTEMGGREEEEGEGEGEGEAEARAEAESKQKRKQKQRGGGGGARPSREEQSRAELAGLLARSQQRGGCRCRGTAGAEAQQAMQRSTVA